ncbi:MAG: reverse transcriptase domain-containing protein, partial [Alphaproteobacteria bacterium]|nr:reverse transcriptase domain-containing protein [Alphaproteobacteria bacterium]
MKMLIKYRDAFSLRDEIGECPNLKADIKVIDDSPFFVRPFPISENDKPFMDDQMERLVSLGILSKNSTSHTSPVMLITRKLTKDKRPVVDFRLLNTRILRRNTSIPLMSDVLSILGNSECEVVSCVDIKDAYHSIRLTEMSKEYCGILPYFGSPIYRYEVLPMGIACAPQIWMDYITLILSELEDKKKYIAIMDDLLIHSTKLAHWKLLEQLLKSMCKNGLRLSPKKCQLFKTNLIYMGNEFTITKRTMTITPLRSRTEAITKIPTPRTPKQCKSFCGVVNYLSLFCPDLQKLLKPIVELTRKERPFIWGEAQEKAFREVKLRLKNPPVLHLPKAEGRFILYSDTSIEGTGSSLWQIQEGKPKLIGYASKTLPEACSRYSVTELEMTGLLVNMNLWKNLLKHREFDAAVDHAAVAQIMKAKTEPATTRIMRLLDRLSAYSFNLYYVKGRDMILSDYLSRHRQKDLDPSELIPISFCCLKTYRSIIDNRIGEEIFCIKTRASAKASGETVGEVHGADKPLDPNYKPEHQSKSKLPSVTGKLSPEKVIRKPISQTPSRHTPKRLATPKSVRIQSEVVSDVAIPDSNSTPKRTPIMVHGGARPKTPMMVKTPSAPSTRTPLTPPHTHLQTPPYVPRKILSSTPPDIGEKNMNIHDKIIKEAEEKISGFDKKMQELEEQNRKIFHPPPIEGIDIGGADGLEILDPEIRIPTEEDFVLPPPLESLLDKAKMAYKFLPKQGDIDRLIAKINKKVLRDTNLCVDLRDLKAAYLTSPHFRDIYLYLLQNRMPLGKGAAKRLDQNARNYLILDGLLFKILENGEGNLDTVLCIPTSKVHILLNAYHSSILGGHTGITKCYHTISQRFYCPNLAENLRAYITGCHVCQLFKKGKDLKRPYQKRINLNVPAMTKISMDIKQMPANKGYSHILVLLCEVTNYMVALPLMSTRTPHILDAFQRGYLAYFGPPTHIICDQDPAFTSSLMEAFVTQLNIKIVLVSPTNHQSLQAEHGIKSLSGLLVKHLSTVWSWHSVLPYSMLCYNGYSSPNLNGYSPYELVFGHKMTLSHELEIKVDTVVSGTFKDYYEKLKKNLQYMGERLQKFRSQRLDLLNKDREYQAFEVGQIVYMFQARGSVVETGSRKIRCNYIGPLVIFKAVGPNQFLLMSLDGLVYPHLIEQSRLKAGTIWTTKGN